MAPKPQSLERSAETIAGMLTRLITDGSLGRGANALEQIAVNERNERIEWRLDMIEGHVQKIAERLEDVWRAVMPNRLGSLPIHVTEVQFSKEKCMPPIDPLLPPLNLPSSSIRAKLSVVNPRLPDGSRVRSVNWNTSSDEILPLSQVPDNTVKILDPDWVDPDPAADPPNVHPLIEAKDPVDGEPLLIFSTFANTPLTPEPGTKVSGIVTVSAPGMASAQKPVTYGDPAVGHFDIVSQEAPEE